MSSAARAAPSAFSTAHKAYVQSLYRRYLRNSLDWCIRRDVWRDRAIEIRAEFERNRNIRNPRELARVLQEAEQHLQEIAHPDPHRRELSFPLEDLIIGGGDVVEECAQGVSIRLRFRTMILHHSIPSQSMLSMGLVVECQYPCACPWCTRATRPCDGSRPAKLEAGSQRRRGTDSPIHDLLGR